MSEDLHARKSGGNKFKNRSKKRAMMHALEKQEYNVERMAKNGDEDATEDSDYKPKSKPSRHNQQQVQDSGLEQPSAAWICIKVLICIILLLGILVGVIILTDSSLHTSGYISHAKTVMLQQFGSEAILPDFQGFGEQLSGHNIEAMWKYVGEASEKNIYTPFVQSLGDFKAWAQMAVASISNIQFSDYWTTDTSNMQQKSSSPPGHTEETNNPNHEKAGSSKPDEVQSPPIRQDA